MPVWRACTGDPSCWIGVKQLALQRVWVDLPLSAARRGTQPRGSWAGRHETERDGAEQRPLRATRRQLDANARDVLDHARADLDQAVPDGRELSPRERVCVRIAARTPCISQNAAVWRASRT